MRAILINLMLLTLLFGCKENDNNDAPKKIEKLSESDKVIKSKIPDTLTAENHSEIMDMILGKPKQQIKSIGILVYDGVNDLDFSGPKYVLGQTGNKVQLIAIKPGNVTTVMGTQIVPNATIDDVKQLDILVIPGGFKGTIEAAYNEKLHDWIRMIDKKSKYTCGVCTGVWVLGATGLLKDKFAVTNWYNEDKFLEKYGAKPAHKRYTNDGKYWTSAGVTAGMDMALAIVNDNWGEKYTQGIMLDMEYDPHPPIEGGTPEKTGFLVEWMMKAMYDAGVNPIIDSLETVKKNKLKYK
jgi:transcriptional regulator GlxA family with amidase domain